MNLLILYLIELALVLWQLPRIRREGALAVTVLWLLLWVIAGVLGTVYLLQPAWLQTALGD